MSAPSCVGMVAIAIDIYVFSVIFSCFCVPDSGTEIASRCGRILKSCSVLGLGLWSLWNCLRS